MTTKTKTIHITHLKAIDEFSADFNGCSAIITGRNNGGKSTLLKTLPDRIRGIRPSIILKDTETQGKAEIELTTGERFLWDFNNEGRDTLVFFTKDGYPTSVTKELSRRFFPALFDIDAFLQSTPKEQTKKLQALVGIDFTDVDARYKAAYEHRTAMNRDFTIAAVKLANYKEVPEQVEEVSTAQLIKDKEKEQGKMKEQREKNQQHNKGLKKQWEELVDKKKEEIESHNTLQTERTTNRSEVDAAHKVLLKFGYKGHEVMDFLADMPEPENERVYGNEAIDEPEYISEEPDNSKEKALDEQINNASEINKKAATYANYLSAKETHAQASETAKNADNKVKEIEAEKQKMIKDAKMPAGFGFNEDGITVDGLPLDKNQLSSSKLYCAALRLASMNLGEVRTLHFDASTLDRNSLAEIEAWAKENDLQLLIERPDFEGGEIKYELIEEKE